MFDIGFTELLLIAIISLLVVNPEKLPTTIRAVLHYIRHFKREINDIRNEIEKELFSEKIQPNPTEQKECLEQTFEKIDNLQKNSQKDEGAIT